MADAKMKISQMGAVLAMDDDDLINVVTYNDQSQTYVSGKATGAKVKEYMVGNNDISDLGDGSATGAILEVKSESESADDDIAETMAKNGAHNHCPFPYHQASGTEANGVTWTYNSKGVLSASGTLTDTYTGLNLSDNTHEICEYFRNGTYKVVNDDLPANVELSVYFNDNVGTYISKVTSGVVTVPANAYYAGIYLMITGTLGSSVSISNIMPLITLASDPSTEYAPYAMTNRELTEKMTSRYQMAKQMYDGQSFIAVGQVSGSDDGWAYITLPFNVQPVSVSVSDMYMPGIKTYANTDLIEFSTTNGIAKYRIADLANYKGTMFVSTITCNY